MKADNMIKYLSNFNYLKVINDPHNLIVESK